MTIAVDRPTRSGTGHGTTPARLDLALPGEPASIGAARHETATFCRHHSLPPELIDDIVLTTSELVTNAVLHARTPLLVTVELDAGHVTVSVLDGTTAHPTFGRRSGGPRVAQQVAGCTVLPLGMTIVGQFGPWGVFRTPLGKTVWTSISARPRGGLLSPR